MCQLAEGQGFLLAAAADTNRGGQARGGGGGVGWGGVGWGVEGQAVFG